MANAEQTEVNQFVRKREELRGSILELENDDLPDFLDEVAYFLRYLGA